MLLRLILDLVSAQYRYSALLSIHKLVGYPVASGDWMKVVKAEPSRFAFLMSRVKATET